MIYDFFILNVFCVICSHQVTPEVADDEVMKDSETDGSEMPLGKIIKRLKAKGAKARRELKTEAPPSGEKNESELDILKMVREINSDNVGGSVKFESSNGHDDSVPKESKTDHKLPKRKTVLDGTNNVPVPKRRRSSSTTGHKSHNWKVSTKKELHSESTDSVEFNSESENTSVQGRTNEPAETELLVSCIRKNSSSSSKQKRKPSSGDNSKGNKARGPGNKDQKVSLYGINSDIYV